MTEMDGWHHQLDNMSLSKLWEMVKDRDAWRAVVHGITKNWTQLSDFHFQFLPRSKHLLISWLQSPSTVILEPKNIKSVTVSVVSPAICHGVMGPDAMILIFEC